MFLLSIITVQTSFAFRLGDADPLINNIWLEPENPKPGDLVSINSSIYNQGTQSTKEVTNVVTIGYIINDELVQISTLTNVDPGIKNGIQITSGPIWKATDGVHTITVILNYHDTLSHLTDNFENNIMQKTYHIGDWQNSLQPLILFELFQETIPDTENQAIKIEGRVNLPNNYPEYRTPRINVEFTDEKKIAQKYSAAVDKDTSSFYWRETMPISRTIIPVTVSFADERYQNFDYDYTSNIYPIDLKQNESLFVLQLSDSTDSFNFKNQDFTVSIYDESYQFLHEYETNQISEYPIKEIETIQLPASPFRIEEPPPGPNPTLSTNEKGDLLYFVLPGGNTYNFEIYSENQMEYSSLKFLEENKVVNDLIKGDENQHSINLKQNEAMLSLELSDPTSSYTFENAEFTVVIFQNSYENLFKKISTYGYDNLSLIDDGNLLTILPANQKYLAEVYLEGKFLTAFDVFLEYKDIVNKEIFIPEPAQVRFEIINKSGEPISNIPVEIWTYSATSDDNGFTDWIEILPTITNEEPYAANATFSDGTVVWSEQFLIEPRESKTIQIIQQGVQNSE